MADQTTNLDLLLPSQANQELRNNQSFDAASLGSYFGRRASLTNGLTWAYYGGKVMVNGVPTTVANGTVTLTGSATNYVQLTQAGAVAVATTRNPLYAPLYQVVTGASGVTNYIDERNTEALQRMAYGRATQVMTDANQTLTQAQALCQTIVTSGAITAARNLVVPLVVRRWTVRNNCAGFGVQVIGATGTGITIAVGKVADVECDGTNVLRITADT